MSCGSVALDDLDVAQARRAEGDLVAVASTARSTRSPLSQVPLRLPSSSSTVWPSWHDQRVPAGDGAVVDLDVRAHAAPEAGDVAVTGTSAPSDSR